MRPETTYVSPWTDACVERLKELWNVGSHSCKEIADELNCGLTRNAVIGKVTRLGLQLRRNRTNFTIPKVKRQKASRTIRKNGTGYVPLGDEGHSLIPDLNSLQDVEAQATPSTFLGIALLKLEFEHCRYPREIGGVMLFCGQPKLERILSDGTFHRSSYCRECHRRCHTGGFGKGGTFTFRRRAA